MEKLREFSWEEGLADGVSRSWRKSQRIPLRARWSVRYPEEAVVDTFALEDLLEWIGACRAIRAG